MVSTDTDASSVSEEDDVKEFPLSPTATMILMVAVLLVVVTMLGFVMV